MAGPTSELCTGNCWRSHTCLSETMLRSLCRLAAMLTNYEVHLLLPAVLTVTLPPAVEAASWCTVRRDARPSCLTKPRSLCCASSDNAAACAKPGHATDCMAANVDLHCGNVD